MNMPIDHPNQFLESLCSEFGWETPSEKVQAAVRDMMKYRGSSFRDYLIKEEVLSAEVLTEVLAAKPDNVSEAEWLAKSQTRAGAYFDRFMAWASDLPYYDALEMFTIHEAMGQKDVARECEEGDFVAMSTDRGTPVLVFGSIQAVYLREALGRLDKERSPVLRFLRERNQEPALLFALSRRDLVGAILHTALGELQNSGSTGVDVSWIFIGNAAETNAQRETRDLSRIIDAAMENSVTDIDLRPLPDGSLRVLMRQYGDLRSVNGAPSTLSSEDGQRALSFLMARSGANPMGSRLKTPADGHLTYRSAAGEAQLRLSFIPLNHPGEVFPQVSTSIRILKQENTSIDLAQLKLDARVIEDIQYATSLTQGLILLVGPTNTGKSTTIAGALGDHFAKYGYTKKRLGAEDPIERWVKGVVQFQVPRIIPGVIDTEEARWNILTRAIKRHDPDVIWLGEIRDEETARACITYASSGHLVFSTIHAKDSIVACDILARMVPDKFQYQLVESMQLSVAQRLVRRLCPTCRVITKVTDEEKRHLDRYAKALGEDSIVAPEEAATPGPRQPSCTCVDGYTGILPVNESLSFTREVRDAWMKILTSNDMEARAVLSNARTLSLLEAGLTRVRAFETDLKNVFH